MVRLRRNTYIPLDTKRYFFTFSRQTEIYHGHRLRMRNIKPHQTKHRQAYGTSYQSSLAIHHDKATRRCYLNVLSAAISN